MRSKNLMPQQVACIEPGSFTVRDEIEAACRGFGLNVSFTPDPHFTCDLKVFNDWADDGRKNLVMENFYRMQRKRLGILMDSDGEPEGGEWNYDKQNRRTFKRSPHPPPPPTFKPDDVTRQVLKEVSELLPELYGKPSGFNWPVTRGQALQALVDFIDNRLPQFGDYQDAMWHGEHTLYHSLLSPPLNLKLLNPREVVHAAVRSYRAGKAPLNAVEGFIRQVIGWREFIRGVYFHEGPGYAHRNGLKQDGRLPDFYWSGDTDMRCMRDALGGVISTAYGHHIARLMVTGNFALIAGVGPIAINDWYLGMYADAVEWVTTPNTVGMVMHADGGVVGTKPYAASGKYIDRMSNYCADCTYNMNQRVGEQACPFNTFYWDFLIRNKSHFKKNHRMRMILKHVEKMDKQERDEITQQAEALRERMGIV
ncbi:MAG: cryptochrome/photolyase family protein [Phycisphaerales bacterium]